MSMILYCKRWKMILKLRKEAGKLLDLWKSFIEGSHLAMFRVNLGECILVKWYFNPFLMVPTVMTQWCQSVNFNPISMLTIIVIQICFSWCQTNSVFGIFTSHFEQLQFPWHFLLLAFLKILKIFYWGSSRWEEWC